MSVDVEEVGNAIRRPVVEAIGVVEGEDGVPVLQCCVGRQKDEGFRRVGVRGGMVVLGDYEGLAGDAAERQAGDCTSAGVASHGHVFHDPVFGIPLLPRKCRMLPIGVIVHHVHVGEDGEWAIPELSADDQAMCPDLPSQEGRHSLPVSLFRLPQKADPVTLGGQLYAKEIPPR